MITMIRDCKGDPTITFDEANNICFYHTVDAVLPMKYNEQTNSYEFEKVLFADQDLLQDAINDGIFEVIHLYVQPSGDA